MSAYFQYYSKLPPFSMFSVQHLITIGIIVLLCALLFVFKHLFKKQTLRDTFRFILAFILIGANVWQQVWVINEKAWSMEKDLPLHLSDLAVILVIIMLLFKSRLLFNFLIFAGVGSSIQAILTPNLGRFSFPHFQFIEFFVSHGGVIIACIFMVLAYGVKPTNKSLWLTLLIVNVYGAGIFIFNKLVGSNYLYLMKKPSNTSLLNYLGDWPWYLFSLELVMLVIFYIIYLPFGIKRKIE